eukprot:6194789-Pleurochrysis_carterae.AAC.2
MSFSRRLTALTNSSAVRASPWGSCPQRPLSGRLMATTWPSLTVIPSHSPSGTLETQPCRRFQQRSPPVAAKKSSSASRSGAGTRPPPQQLCRHKTSEGGSAASEHSVKLRSNHFRRNDQLRQSVLMLMLLPLRSSQSREFSLFSTRDGSTPCRLLCGSRSMTTCPACTCTPLHCSSGDADSQPCWLCQPLPPSAAYSAMSARRSLSSEPCPAYSLRSIGKGHSQMHT